MNYADSSFLAALYLGDDAKQAQKADAFMLAEAYPIFFTSFNRVELRNALRLSQWRGNADTSQLKQAFETIAADLREGFLVHTLINHTEVYRLADELSERHSGCRTLDLLHVASALSLKTRYFLTFDVRQATLVQAAGLRVKP